MLTHDTPTIVAEEEAHLCAISRRLHENPEGPGASEAEIVKELVTLQNDLRDARSEDKGALQQQMAHQMARLDQVRKGRPKGTVDPDSPYFGHLKLDEKGKSRDIFLGRATRLGPGLRIVDWRNAPISRLFYRYREGDEFFEEMGGRHREGTIAARRTVHIEQGELKRVTSPAGTWVRDPDGWSVISQEAQRLAGGQGTSLRQGQTALAALGAGTKLRADKHLPDIAALIDPEQFDLITGPNSGVVVLRGSAGSGKTTVALHRIAFLAYEGGRKFRPGRVLVVVWGRAMRDYVTHVLPALGIEGVKVTTWSSWARKLVKRHFQSLPTEIAEDTPEPVTRIKLHPGVSEQLAARVAQRTARPTRDEAIQDWADLLTDRAAIAQAMGEDISPAALDRAMVWLHAQTSAVDSWAEGNREVDARLDQEDDALLLRAWQTRVGPLRDTGKKPLRHAHIVLDEVQDFSPIEVRILLDTTDENRSVTLAGDTRQHISQAAGFSSWQGFLDRIGIPSTALSTLEVSYRSTHPITRFALEVLSDQNEPPPRTTRDGPEVELFRFPEQGACVTFLAECLGELLATEPLANVAILTPSPAMSKMYADGLKAAELRNVRLVEDQTFAFAPGVDVVEADQVKGLEFDYVVIVEASGRNYPDTPHHRRLLHVAATRAVHQLWLSTVDSPSAILPKI
jgi:DNA helicase-2/ATP-dependent DNA helicase PcrA